jgi:hypothetical protein
MKARASVRARALRAAHAVTITFALAGCGSGDTEDLSDSGVDGGVVADAGGDGLCTGDASNDPDCCVQSGGTWVEGGGCAVPGPFVPPPMPARLA